MYTYIDLAQDREADAVIQLAKLLNLVIAPWILAAELVAGEAEDFKVIAMLRLEVFVQLLQPGKLRRETTLRSRVYHQHHFAVQLREVVCAATL